VAWLGYVYVGYPLMVAVLAFVRRFTLWCKTNLAYCLSFIAAHNEEKISMESD